MDGTMIDSMPAHKRSWWEFARRKQLAVDVDDLHATAPPGAPAWSACASLFGDPAMDEAMALAYVHEKEAVYRETLSTRVCRGGGLPGFFRPGAPARA